MPPPPGPRLFLLKGLAKVGFLEGLAKPVALWSRGPVVSGPTSRGPLVSWSSGRAVLWSRGPPVPYAQQYWLRAVAYSGNPHSGYLYSILDSHAVGIKASLFLA